MLKKFFGSLLFFILLLNSVFAQDNGQKNSLKGKVKHEVKHVAHFIDNTLSPLELAQGFELLFNGNNLEVWNLVGPPTTMKYAWEVKKGELQILASDSSKNRVHGDLTTFKEYSSFELNFDFKLSAGANSGVKYFVIIPNPTQRAGLGLEYQILDDERHPDAKLGLNGNRTLSSLYDIMPATPLDTPFKKNIGQWNHGVIIVHANQLIQHWLNGFKVLEYVKGDARYLEAIANSKFAKNNDFAKNKITPILIQDHGDAVSYKKIKIRKIK
ncbi:MAG: DUF1080 domain-containing protein [Bacteroidetes bacterium]|nr:DUF1080 domain-containing protein [Bacteroidota bacterium]